MARGKAAGRYSPRRRGDGDGGDAAWLTTYGDMVTLLLAFFVLLYSMSTLDVAKFEAFVSGLAVPFGNSSGDGMMPASDGLDGGAEASLSDPLQLAPPASELEVRTPLAADDRDAAEAETGDVDRDPAEDEDSPEDGDPDRRVSLEEIQAALDAALEERGLAELVEQRREERGLIVSIATDDVLFALASTDIDELGAQVIETVSHVLRNYPNDVLVEGHTDDLPLRRPGYTNWNLSTDRAVAVLSEMIDTHTFPADQIGAVGYGEHRPYVPNDGRTARSRNRRVDIVVLREEHRL